MTGYSIAEEYTLPSLGRIYTQKVNPVVKLRSMTTEDEMKRLSRSDRPYQNLCEIIDDCMVEKCGISSYDMCLADYQFLLHKLRVVTYGPDYKTETTCPYCMSTNTSVINLDELKVSKFDEKTYKETIEFVLPNTGKRIRLKFQTPRMIDNINVESRELNKKTRGQAIDSSLLFTVRDLIDTVDGEHLDYVQRDNFVRNLPMMDTNYIMKKAEKLVESFGLQTEIDCVCSTCGLDYTSSFRFSSEFFGPSID